jgi:hypothetical protein
MDSTLFSAAAYEIPSIRATCATVSISFLLFLLAITAIFHISNPQICGGSEKVRLRGISGYKERKYAWLKVRAKLQI